MLGKVTYYWQGLTIKQQQVLTVLLPFLVLCVAYAIVIYPIQHYKQQLQTEVSAKQQLVRWMQNATPALLFIKQHNIVPATSLATAIEAATHIFSGSSPTIALLPDKQMKITFTNIDFDRWLLWLASLQYSFRMDVLHCDIRKLAAPGLVTVSITIREV